MYCIQGRYVLYSAGCVYLSGQCVEQYWEEVVQRALDIVATDDFWNPTLILGLQCGGGWGV